MESKNPQLEHGYVKIANEVFDALCHYRIPGEERQILDVVIRKTYGFNKHEDCISLSQFCDATGINKPNVRRAIKALIEKNIVIKKDNGHISKYRFNKLYRSWKPLSKKITNSRALSKKITSVIKKDNPSLSKMIPTKDNTTKDNTTKDKETITTNVVISKKEKSENKTNEYIGYFSGVNPSYKRLYPNKTQRAALDRMIAQYDNDWLKNLILSLEKIVTMPFAPRITTPIQLELKMGELKVFVTQQKEKNNKFSVTQL